MTDSTEQQPSLDLALRTVIETMINGIAVSTPGVPPPVAMERVAFHVGNVLGRIVRADLVNALKLRAAIKAAFAEGLEKAPISQAPVRPPLRMQS